MERLTQIIDDSIFDDLFMAGSESYYFFWSRDFLFAAPFLIKNPKWRLTVYKTLKTLLRYKSKNNQLPKSLDTHSSVNRIVYNAYRTFRNRPNYQWRHKRNPDETPAWKPTYRDHNGSRAIDTNLLFIKVVLQLSKYHEFSHFARSIKKELIDLLIFYNEYINNNTDYLIQQPAYSDWKDSLNRKGITFLTNLMYWKVLHELETFETKPFIENLPNSRAIKSKINQTFFHEGVYCSQKGQRESFGLDENLLAIDWGFVTGTLAEQLMDRLIQRREFIAIPGLAVYPKQTWYNKPLYALVANSGGYHDDSCWSWIIALAAKIAKNYGFETESEHLKKLLEAIIERDQTIYDAYTLNPKLKTLERYTVRGFRAEPNFLWGAAYSWELFNETIKDY